MKLDIPKTEIDFIVKKKKINIKRKNNLYAKQILNKIEDNLSRNYTKMISLTGPNLDFRNKLIEKQQRFSKIVTTDLAR